MKKILTNQSTDNVHIEHTVEYPNKVDGFSYYQRDLYCSPEHTQTRGLNFLAFMIKGTTSAQKSCFSAVTFSNLR